MPSNAKHFGDDLAAAVERTGNPVVVGLDPRCRPEQIPVSDWIDLANHVFRQK